MRCTFGPGVLAAGMLALSTLVPAPAMAQAASQWRVAGSVNGKAFALKCQFDESGEALGGACTELASEAGAPEKLGKRHVLTKGHILGADITWAYPVRVMLVSVEIAFAGKIHGASMAGTVTAAGRQGTFTAVKL